MDLNAIGEFGLIDRIRSTFMEHSRRVPLGIGDDAAALLVSPSTVLLASTDMLIEGVHFERRTTDLFSLGWKSAAVNLSDIAAMGGAPRFCLTALGIPRRFSVEDVREFYRGLAACLRTHGTALVGGDTCASRRGLIIGVTLLGESPKGQVVARSGARPGDRIFVSGNLGDSGAGLELLRKGVRRRTSGTEKKSGPALRPSHAALITRHLRPVPRVAWGRKLAAAGCVSSMIDVSDGLSSDLGHLCEQSGVGAEVRADLIPLSRDLRGARGLKRPALEYALSGGEDYELLFTVPAAKVKTLRGLRIPASEIGRIVRGRTRTLLAADGGKGPLRSSGYDHFRPSAGARKGSARR